MRAWTFVQITLAVVLAHLLAAWFVPASATLPASGPGTGRRPVARVAWAALPAPRLDTPVDSRPPAEGDPRGAPIAGPAAPGHPASAIARAPAAARADARALYATRPPPPTTLTYRLHQANPGGRTLDGPAQLEWRADPAGWSLRLALQPTHGPERSWTSDGAFDRTGLAPHRLVQRDGSRETRRLELADGAAATVTHRLAAGSQDRWSWIAQLAAILEARSASPPPHVDLAVTGLRGDVEQWRFALRGAVRRPPPLPGEGDAPLALEQRQAARLLLMVREPQRPFDLRIEAWLDPARHHWPVALRLSTPPSRWTFYLYPEPRRPDA